MSLLLVVCLGVFVPVRADDPDPAATAPFSIEGLHVGMTRVEVEAAGFRQVNHHGPQDQRGLLWKLRLVNRPIEVLLGLDGKSVRTITVDYTTMHGLSTVPKVEMSFEDLVAVLSAQWGPTSSRDTKSDDLQNIFGTTVEADVSQVAIWVRGDETAAVTYSQQITSFPTVYNTGWPMLRLTISRPPTSEELAAQKAAEEAAAAEARQKVKF
jgi:hypothetical protein